MTASNIRQLDAAPSRPAASPYRVGLAALSPAMRSPSRWEQLIPAAPRDERGRPQQLCDLGRSARQSCSPQQSGSLRPAP